MSLLSADPRTLAREAYTYLYPLVMMDVTRRQGTSPAAAERPGYGPPNQFDHLREFPSAEFRAVVRPNFDTLYSNAWLDLTGGPVKLHVTDTADRYFMLPLMDMWTDVFATIGKRTTGTGDQDYLIVGPGHDGTAQAGVTVLRAPTPHVWIIGRTQTNGPADYPAVWKVQDGYTLTAEPPREYVHDDRIDVTADALAMVSMLGAAEFFTWAARALAVNPPHDADFSLLARIANLGIVPGQEFDPGLVEADLAEIEAGVQEALTEILGSMASFGSAANGWRTSLDTMGVYGNSYFKRAAVAAGGLGANPPEDAVYPVLATDADGDPVNGDHDYILRFEADAMPPAGAFWSVTMYDGEGYQAANEINRFALGDRDDLAHDEQDGSLTIYISQHNPGPDRESNWLPAPSGPLGITMRLYAPKPDVLDGTWNPPAVAKA
ncbi:DUF1254 domain-containing protein [Kitasatospora sp. CMC57]|uniref:DUF1254 domain-containing protein n=1 Tax=Kitasatospora sp. CMC57 TaxID=3231513 RepID=A0AB33K2D0_9ACTN